jgi:hypothetical protein
MVMNVVPSLVHLLDERINVLLAVSKVTSLDEVLELSGPEASSWVGELERPQKVADLLEVGANGVNLVDEILDADNSQLAQLFFDNGIVSQCNALLVAAGS